MSAGTGAVLYVSSVHADAFADGERPRITAWRPEVPGVAEVFHARFAEHAYPMHTHEAWTLLIVDDGAITFDLDRHHHGAAGGWMMLLPPHVPHDGRAASPGGFGKRVLYLDETVLGADLIGAAVNAPILRDSVLGHRLHQLHRALAQPGEELEAESRLTLIRERLYSHLRARDQARVRPPATLAVRLRELLDARVTTGLTLATAAAELNAHPTHLVRSFTTSFGLPPHRYLTGRRVELARGRLLAGERPADVALATGFYDQAHLTRHFKRHLGISPARYAAST